MTSQTATVLIMAAGTGGHVFPALAIAEVLKGKAANVHWLGTPNGMENELLEGTGIPLHKISISGLVGSGIKRKLLAPIMLLSAFIQSLKVLRLVKPDCVLGMGGFVCGPAGLAAKFLRKPLLIHEQNAVAGFTNKLLSRLACRTLEAFPGTFKKSPSVLLTGNPVRKEIASMGRRDFDSLIEKKTFNILVLGGSQGALAINTVVPELLADIDNACVCVVHQAGKGKVDQTRQAYESAGLSLGGQYNVQAFVSDMASAYDWADLVICRSGASTVCEIAAAGKASILIPYPYHRDKQQTRNANWLASEKAAIIIEQAELTAVALSGHVKYLLANRNELVQMSKRASRLAIRDAADVIANECLRYAND
jgi:UDP-N-acetylglucosamine--N-acetylmuramyl-(pentapeptide) pyrophosphoryl-undecaprenol N-acetylglucosamine transferase